MRKIFTTIVALTLLSSGFAQSLEQDKTVAERRAEQREAGIRPGESVEYCGTHWKNQEMLEKNPAMKTLYEKAHKQLNLDAHARTEARLAKKGDNSEAKAAIYTIPVVFHIMHQYGGENISNEQIEDALFILNRDFNLQNADANSVVSTFTGMPTDGQIEFVMATISPNGNCFNGITRTVSDLTFDGSSGGAQVNDIIDDNDVDQGSDWEGYDYLNIFVVQDAGGAAGYTTNPWQTGMTNGIWILHNYVGSIGTGNASRSRALTHEVGHWLNLSHTWGGNNNPGSGDCFVDAGWGGQDNNDDGVADTPRCLGMTSCLLSQNSCDNDDINGYWGSNGRPSDVVDNAENYMDYSYCSKMFTSGQVDRMHTALNSSTGGRSSIWSTANLNQVGANSSPVLCKAEFQADNFEVCSGDVVTFEDLSFSNVSTWNWTFNGGSPSSSTSQDPVITYNTPGTYAVTLTAGDGSSSVSETKTSYITVLPSIGASAPLFEGFESLSSIPTSDWFVDNPDGGTTWNVTTAAAATGSKSMRVVNTAANEGNTDEFVSSTIDLSNATDAIVSFKYAFRKRNDANADKVTVWVSKDCGATWALRKNISAFTLTTGSNTTSNSWSPSANEWVEVEVSNISATYWTSNFRFKIGFVSGGGNNVYIDDINVSKGVPTSLEDVGYISSLELYPNPMDEMATLQFNLNGTHQVEAFVTDVIGKRVMNLSSSNRIEGEHKLTINKSDLKAGIYMVNVLVDGIPSTKRLIVR